MCTHLVGSFQTNPVELTLTANEKQLSTKVETKVFTLCWYTQQIDGKVNNSENVFVKNGYHKHNI